MTINEYAYGTNPLRVHLAHLEGTHLVAVCHRPGAWRLTDRVAFVTCATCKRIGGDDATSRAIQR